MCIRDRRSVLKVTGRISNSPFVQYIRLDADSTRLEFETAIDWKELQDVYKRQGRKVKGTIHWVACQTAVKATVRLYENIIDEEKGVYNEDGSLNLNPNSLTVKEAWIEPSLKEAKPYESFQFVRQGYF